MLQRLGAEWATVDPPPYHSHNLHGTAVHETATMPAPSDVSSPQYYLQCNVTHTHTHVHTLTHIHTLTYTHSHTHTCAHTHTYL